MTIRSLLPGVSARGSAIGILGGALLFALVAGSAAAQPEPEEEPEASPASVEGEQEDEEALDPALRFAETVVVTATRSDAPLLTTPAAVSVLTGDDLVSEAPRAFVDLFEGMPGVQIQGNARRITEAPNIRGFADQQVVVRQDGGRQNFHAAHGGRFFVDPDLVQRVEVLRGANSALFGSGALGGVVSLTTRTARDLLEPGENFGGRYRIGYQSNGRDFGQSFSAFAAGESLDLLGSFALGGTGAPVRDGNGDAIPNTEDELRNGLVKLGWIPGARTRFEASWQSFVNRAAEPTNANALTGTLVDRDTQWEGLRAKFEIRSLESELLDVEALAYRNAVDVVEEMRIRPRMDGTRFETLGIELTNTARFRPHADAGVVVSAGLEAYRDRQSGTRDGADRLQFPDADAAYLAAFLHGEVELRERFHITAGLRRDSWRLEAERFGSRREEQVSPRATAGYRIGDGGFVWVGASRGFRVPSLTELFSDGLHFQFPIGPGIEVLNWFRPDPGLPAERALSWEAGFRGGRSAWTLETTCFRQTVANYVDQRVFLSDPAYPLRVDPVTGISILTGSTVNVPLEARLQGCEGTAGYERPRLRLRAAASLLGTEDTESGVSLARAPANRLDLSASTRIPRLALEIGGRAILAAERTEVPALVEEGPGYRVFDLFLRYNPADGPLRGVDWTVAVNNLTDEYFAVFPAVVPQPGRSLRISAAYRFGRSR